MVGTNIPRVIHDDARIISLTVTDVAITNATLTGDLIRRNGCYKSGTATGYGTITQTAAQWDYEFPDEGINFLYGDQGSMFGHLPSTPIAGKVVTFILANSGATTAYIGSGCISGNFLRSIAGTTETPAYGVLLMYPHSKVSIVNDGTFYYILDTGWTCGTNSTTDTDVSGAKLLF